MSLGVICVIAMAVSSANAGPQDRCIKSGVLAKLSNLQVGTLADQDNVIVKNVRRRIQNLGLLDAPVNKVKCDKDLLAAGCCQRNAGNWIPFGAVVDWIMVASKWDHC